MQNETNDTNTQETTTNETQEILLTPHDADIEQMLDQEENNAQEQGEQPMTLIPSLAITDPNVTHACITNSDEPGIGRGVHSWLGSYEDAKNNAALTNGRVKRVRRDEKGAVIVPTLERQKTRKNNKKEKQQRSEQRAADIRKERCPSGRDLQLAKAALEYERRQLVKATSAEWQTSVDLDANEGYLWDPQDTLETLKKFNLMDLAIKGDLLAEQLFAQLKAGKARKNTAFDALKRSHFKSNKCKVDLNSVKKEVDELYNTLEAIGLIKPRAEAQQQ